MTLTGDSTVTTWDGKAWTVPTSAITTRGLLYGASCANTRFCFVVGGTVARARVGTVAILGRS